MPDGGTLKIYLEDTVSDVIFIVSDTGTGIKEEDKPKIFEPFFTTKGLGQGNGTGAGNHLWNCEDAQGTDHG
ncbi:MAG: ATP-binding protein [Marinilabiliales bacterium]|nr:ATP-binding protein [Marinilabiliales bacterium]